MAQLLVRNLDDAVKQRLQRRAARRGHSMEEEAREILRAAADQDEAESQVAKLGTRIAQRFAGLGMIEELPELHGMAVPVDLGPA
jgi:antitoxin FitA